MIKRFTTVKYITPYDKIIEYYDLDSSKFNFNPTLNPMKLNNYFLLKKLFFFMPKILFVGVVIDVAR